VYNYSDHSHYNLSLAADFDRLLFNDINET
jgi:hypothetical protein